MQVGESGCIVGAVMLPDFRFVLGAVLATALLVVTGIGLFSAVKVAHQARVGPLEASRSLAFAPEHGRPRFRDATPRFGMPSADDPFANLPRGSALDVVEAPTIVIPEIATPDVLAQAPLPPPIEPEIPAPAEATTSAPDEADAVDERAVVDPPLPDDDGTDIAAEPNTQPIVESQAQPVSGPNSQSVAEPNSQPLAEPSTQMIVAEPAVEAEPNAEPPVAAPAVQAAAANEPAAQADAPNDPAHVGSLPPPSDPPERPAAEPVIADTPNTAAPLDDSAASDREIVDTLGGDLSTSPAPTAIAKSKSPEKKKAAPKKAAAKKKAKAKPKRKAAKTRPVQQQAQQQPAASMGYSIWFGNPEQKSFWPGWQ
jgi:hypothetical protein